MNDHRILARLHSPQDIFRARCRNKMSICRMEDFWTRHASFATSPTPVFLPAAPPADAPPHGFAEYLITRLPAQKSTSPDEVYTAVLRQSCPRYPWTHSSTRSLSGTRVSCRGVVVVVVDVDVGGDGGGECRKNNYNTVVMCFCSSSMQRSRASGLPR